MNDAHYHLALNHFPIIVPIIGLLVLVAGLILRSDVVKRTAFSIFILGAVLTYPAMATGERAEDVVEGLQGISEQIIHEHEEIAERFAILSYALGILSLAAFWAGWKGKSFAYMFGYAILVFSLVVIFFSRQTATSGGEIRHIEIRDNALAPATERKEH